LDYVTNLDSIQEENARMSQSQWVMDVDSSTFAQTVLERSHEVPVLVDFWAPWCGPCRMLGPILEKLANEMAGRFVLAKVNSDQNPQLGRQFGVRGIPAVKLFVKGAVADAFTGALPESEIRQFLDRAIPNAADQHAQQGLAHEQAGHIDQAGASYQTALEHNPNQETALLGMARLLLSIKRFKAAQTFLDRLPPQAMARPEVKALLAQMAFNTAGESDLETVRKQVTLHPEDLAARLILGRALAGTGQHAAAMDQFLEVVRRDRQYEDQAGRKGVLQVFDMLGPIHPLVMEYRKKLSAVLFS
jgi:putative thioredoxin